jgi:hypothetical protein
MALHFHLALSKILELLALNFEINIFHVICMTYINEIIMKGSYLFLHLYV